MDALINLAIFLSLLALGYFAGVAAEKRHYWSIKLREKKLLHLPVVTFKKLEDEKKVERVELVTGSVVVALDYFKMVWAALRNIFGGRVRAYETLLDRARREAILRMKEKAWNADIILNLRLETTALGGRYGQRGTPIGGIEVIAYGTAVTFEK
jgi:uncharacterized protein YbjQ (UPF0145 family)